MINATTVENFGPCACCGLITPELADQRDEDGQYYCAECCRVAALEDAADPFYADLARPFDVELVYVIAYDTFFKYSYDTGLRIPAEPAIVEATLLHLHRTTTSRMFSAVEELPEGLEPYRG